MVISNVKQREDWMRRSLRINRRQGSKKFLIVVIKSRLEAEPESVLGLMSELAEIVL